MDKSGRKPGTNMLLEAWEQAAEKMANFMGKVM